MTENLAPNTNTPVTVNGVVSYQSEEQLSTLLPRANGTASVVIAGTVASGDVVELTITSKLFEGGSHSVSVTAATDTDTTLADRLAAAVLADSIFQNYGILAEADPTAGKVDLIWPGPLSAFATVAATTTGAETFTLVQFTGGSGPVIPLCDFNFSFNGSVVEMINGRRKTLGSDALAALITNGLRSIK